MNTAITTDFEARWKALLAHRDKMSNINTYIADGFEKVCDVDAYYSDWMYRNINKELMFSPHCSWVYFIVEHETIVKCGETGNPLGIPESRYTTSRWPIQPIGSSACRLGRLRKGDGTDSYIRRELRNSINSGINVSIWAKKCKVQVLNENVGGVPQNVNTTIHKSVEAMYLEHFKNQSHGLPRLNKASK